MMNSFCSWEAAKYFVYSSNVPSLLYYSHVPIMLVVLIIGFLIYFANRKSPLGVAMLALFASVSAWLAIDIVLWAVNDPQIVMFLWPTQIIVEIAVYVFSLYLVKAYVGEDKLSYKVMALFSVVLLPGLVILNTKYGITGVTLVDCYAIETDLIVYLTYIVEIFIALWILVLLIKYNRVKNNSEKEIKYFTFGIIFFLISFSFGNIIGSFTDDWTVAQYGLFGMPIFIALLTYIIVKYQTFNIKILATQALMWGLAVMIGSQFFFIRNPTNYILNTITFLGVIILGRILVRSVKREVDQREHLEVLRLKLEESNVNLGFANDKLKDLDKLKTEFLSLASHQLRSPLTAIKGYASMVVEGDFGEIGQKAKDAVDRIFQSSQNLTLVVEDLLNVSKIEQGGMKYAKENFSMTEIVKTTAEDLAITASKKGLVLKYTEDNGNHMVNGDKEKLRQVVLNLIDNSIKYTKTGNIDVSLVNKGGKVVAAIKDTGMGVSPEIKATLFQKFARGQGQTMNTSGSGLGLYLAKEIVDAHKGNVWVESPGLGFGSTFFIELDEVKI